MDHASESSFFFFPGCLHTPADIISAGALMENTFLSGRQTEGCPWNIKEPQTLKRENFIFF